MWLFRLRSLGSRRCLLAGKAGELTNSAFAIGDLLSSRLGRRPQREWRGRSRMRRWTAARRDSPSPMRRQQLLPPGQSTDRARIASAGAEIRFHPFDKLHHPCVLALFFNAHRQCTNASSRGALLDFPVDARSVRPISVEPAKTADSPCRMPVSGPGGILHHANSPRCPPGWGRGSCRLSRKPRVLAMPIYIDAGRD